MELLLYPRYNHTNQRSAPDSNLTMHTGAEVYFKIKPYLAIAIDGLSPGGWPELILGKKFSRDLFSPSGFHYPVRWQPYLKKGWRRLTYIEFCNWYGLSERVASGAIRSRKAGNI